MRMLIVTIGVIASLLTIFSITWGKKPTSVVAGFLAVVAWIVLILIEWGL